MTKRFVFGVEARFLLSCRVILGICDQDKMCMEEMSHRFPDCYLDAMRSSSSGQFEHHISGPPPAIVATSSVDGKFMDEENFDNTVNLEKRTPAYKLMNILMAKDRIPVG
uniref:Uncharacterized protein n=1 Tax=Ditylenchus dipsaci TaxID=166011 RepID=A0A915D733_9BILA